MERNGIGWITLEYTAQDYLSLNLSVNSSEVDWEKAIDILQKRFEERFFSTINYLSFDRYGTYRKYKGLERTYVSKVEYNGFAIMALVCLLIDTFYQFEYGLNSSMDINPQTGKRKLKDNYPFFLRDKFNHLFPDNNDLADLFYDDIRNGILHSAQTKNESILAFEGDFVVEYTSNGRGIRVNILGMAKELKRYFKNDYIYRLKNGDIETRENFIKKMNYICSR